MSYAADVIAILNKTQAILETPRFATVIRGWKAETDIVKAMPTTFIVCRADSLTEQAGARAESRRLAIDLYTLNNVSHDKAIELSGIIVDRLDPNPTLDGLVAWTKLQNVEFYINVMKGYDLHWSRLTYEMERRRTRP